MGLFNWKSSSPATRSKGEFSAVRIAATPATWAVCCVRWSKSVATICEHHSNQLIESLIAAPFRDNHKPHRCPRGQRSSATLCSPPYQGRRDSAGTTAVTGHISVARPVQDWGCRFCCPCLPGPRSWRYWPDPTSVRSRRSTTLDRPGTRATLIYPWTPHSTRGRRRQGHHLRDPGRQLSLPEPPPGGVSYWSAVSRRSPECRYRPRRHNGESGTQRWIRRRNLDSSVSTSDTAGMTLGVCRSVMIICSKDGKAGVGVLDFLGQTYRSRLVTLAIWSVSDALCRPFLIRMT
jgi:hypothetical protein